MRLALFNSRQAKTSSSELARQSAGEEVIAQQDARFVVPADVDRVEVAADGSLVQHVVVDQRGRVDHFHRRGQEDVGRAKTRTGQPAQQQQGRPQAFAAQPEAVFDQVVDEGVFAPQLLAEDFFDLMKTRLNWGI